MPRGVPGTHDLGHDKLLEPEDVPLVGLHLEGLAAQEVRELLHAVDDAVRLLLDGGPASRRIAESLADEEQGLVDLFTSLCVRLRLEEDGANAIRAGVGPERPGQ
jgi:hypothetical protein